MKFSLLNDDWGTEVERDDDRGLEDREAEEPAVPALLSKRSRGGQVSSANKLTSSHITDYFAPRLSVIMEDVRKEMEWEDEEFFATATTPMRHLRSEGVPKRRSEAEGLTADVSSNGKLVDWWGSLYEEQDDFDELVEEYLKPREAPDSGKYEKRRYFTEVRRLWEEQRRL